jgi:hypothetical protein
MVSTTNVSDLPQTPFAIQQAYLPDQLIAGPYPTVTENETVISQGSSLARGTVMGKILAGAVTAVGPTGTGNGTISAVTKAGQSVQLGAYRIQMTAATAFDVIDPNGRKLKSGSTGVAYSDDIAFTITAGGTPFVAGDYFTATVAAGSNKITPAVATATDGSHKPIGVLVDKVDSGSDFIAGVYKTGEFNGNSLTLDASYTLATIKPLLAAIGCFIKTPLSATDPT